MYFCLHTNLRYFWWQLLGKLVLEAKVLILAPKWLLLLGKQDLIREKESIVIPVVSNGHLVSLMIVCSRRPLLLNPVARYGDLNGHERCPICVAYC